VPGRKRDNGSSFHHPLNASHPLLDKLSDGLGIRGDNIAVYNYFGEDIEISRNKMNLLQLLVSEELFYDPVLLTGLHVNH